MNLLLALYVQADWYTGKWKSTRDYYMYNDMMEGIPHGSKLKMAECLLILKYEAYIVYIWQMGLES